MYDFLINIYNVIVVHMYVSIISTINTSNLEITQMSMTLITDTILYIKNNLHNY